MSYVESVGIPGLFGLTGAKTAYKDENILLGEAQAINFTGDGVTATLDAGVLNIDVPSSGGSSIDVVDNLLSTSETDALSANQGRVLSETIANLTANDVGADEAGAADTAEQNAKDYADGLVTGLWDDRGTHDASLGNYPSSGGSGVAGAILKGDIWTISVAGTLGANTVEVGDTVRALVDSPVGDSTWAIGQNNIGWVPENVTNKATNLTSPNDTDYPTTQAVVTALADYQEALPAPTGATKFLREDLTWQDVLPTGAVQVVNIASGLFTASADTSYLLRVTGSCTLNLDALTEQVTIAVDSNSNVVLTKAGTLVWRDEFITAITPSVTLTTGTIARFYKSGADVWLSRYQKIVASDLLIQKTAGLATGLTFSLSELVASQAITMPNKAVHLGSIPAIATTNSNSNTGTRTTITGGQFNTVTGTDVNVIGGNNNTATGTRNTLINCKYVTLPANTVDCKFDNLFNNYTAPEAPLTLQNNILEVTFSGWINPLVSLPVWPKGSNVKGEKTKIMSGTFGVSGARYLYKVHCTINLAGTSSAGAVNLLPIGDTRLPMSAQQATLFGAGFAEHIVVIQGYDPIANQEFTGKRRLTDDGNGTVLTDVIGTDLTTGGFVPLINVSNAVTSGYYGLAISVRNSANSNNCFWTAYLESDITHFQEKL